MLSWIQSSKKFSIQGVNFLLGGRGDEYRQVFKDLIMQDDILG